MYVADTIVPEGKSLGKSISRQLAATKTMSWRKEGRLQHSHQVQ